MAHEHNPTIPADSTRYFTNARGVNYLPPMKSEWESTGGIPRFSPASVATAAILAGESFSVSYDNSSIFFGTNKTAQWWYYNSGDHDYYLSMLKEVGINCVRVFLDYYVYEADAETHLNNVKDFLRLCDKHKIRCQFVIWDGIQLGVADAIGAAISEPTSRGSLDSVPFGLNASWRAVPHSFEYDTTAQAQDFYDNVAEPYLQDLVSSVSSYQSMWSFDVQNELDSSNARVFTSATCNYLRDNVSSVGIKVTVGNGAGYDPGMTYLYYDSGGLSGSVGLLYDFSGIIDFASMHTYGNTKYSLIRYVNEGASGASDTGIPSMYNESTFYSNISYPKDELTYFYTVKDMGGMMFDGFVERSLSREPFLTVQGLFYEDGTTKRNRDVSAYVTAASSENWFSPNQLKTVHTQKEVSVDGGADMGFWSGTTTTIVDRNGDNQSVAIIPSHVEWNSSYSGISEDDWVINRDIHYLLFPTNSSGKLLGGVHPKASLTFPDSPGSVMGQNKTYNFSTSDITIQNLIEDHFYGLSSLQDLASYSSEDADVKNRNSQLMYMNEVIRAIAFSTYDNEINSGDPERKILTGTQWDYNEAVTAEARDEVYAGISALKAFNGSTSSIAPYLNDIHLETGDLEASAFICHETSSCLYRGGYVIDNEPTMADINWTEYDTYYDNLIEKLAVCIEQSQAYSDPDFNLY